MTRGSTPATPVWRLLAGGMRGRRTGGAGTTGPGRTSGPCRR